MQYVKEEAVLDKYLNFKSLKHSHQKRKILQAFLAAEKHLTAEEIYHIVKKRIPSIGFATIYRTLNLFCKCGLAREVRFEDGTARYEHLYEHQHHDHLVCTKCGTIIEIVDPRIEQLQDKHYKEHGFIVKGHRMDLYGICKQCQNKYK